jgi:hypothetical protein
MGCFHTRKEIVEGLRRSPQVVAAGFRLAEAPGVLGGVFAAIELVVELAVDVVKGELDLGGDVTDGEEGQVVDVLVGVVAHAREDAQVGVAAVVDEARGAAEVLAVDLERGAAEAGVVAVGVGELVQREQVDVLLLHDLGGAAATLGFLRRDDLAHVLVDELAALDRATAVDTWTRG